MALELRPCDCDATSRASPVCADPSLPDLAQRLQYLTGPPFRRERHLSVQARRPRSLWSRSCLFRASSARTLACPVGDTSPPRPADVKVGPEVDHRSRGSVQERLSSPCESYDDLSPAALRALTGLQRLARLPCSASSTSTSPVGVPASTSHRRGPSASHNDYTRLSQPPPPGHRADPTRRRRLPRTGKTSLPARFTLVLPRLALQIEALAARMVPKHARTGAGRALLAHLRLLRLERSPTAPTKPFGNFLTPSDPQRRDGLPPHPTAASARTGTLTVRRSVGGSVHVCSLLLADPLPVYPWPRLPLLAIALVTRAPAFRRPRA
jgi:hypothetical protein